MEEYALSIGKNNMFTKTHADNIFSINNIYKDGYKLVHEYESERGRNQVFAK